jgi:hypothetical protein
MSDGINNSERKLLKKCFILEEVSQQGYSSNGGELVRNAG